MVAIPAVASHAPDTAFDIANFTYDQVADTSTARQDKHSAPTDVGTPK